MEEFSLLRDFALIMVVAACDLHCIFTGSGNIDCAAYGDILSFLFLSHQGFYKSGKLKVRGTSSPIEEVLEGEEVERLVLKSHRKNHYLFALSLAHVISARALAHPASAAPSRALFGFFALSSSFCLFKTSCFFVPSRVV